MSVLCALWSWALLSTTVLDPRPDVLLKESKWTKMFFGEGQASLSFSHLNKDDEGLYTLRIVSRGGISDHSAFLFVRGARLWRAGVGKVGTARSWPGSQEGFLGSSHNVRDISRHH